MATAAGRREEKLRDLKALSRASTSITAPRRGRQHISNGMYGLILVEPAGGLPKVDREFYVMQGEIYTDEPRSTARGIQLDKLLDEPRLFRLQRRGRRAHRTEPLKAKVGDSVRIFFGDGGPNLISSFHVIGEIFDRA